MADNYKLEGLVKDGLSHRQQTLWFSDSLCVCVFSFSLLPLTFLSLKLLINCPYTFCDFLISSRKGGMFML